MFQAKLFKMMQVLEDNNLQLSDLQVYSSINYIKLNNKELEDLIDHNYENIHSDVENIYFKSENIEIDTIALVVIAAIDLGKLDKLNKWQLINLCLAEHSSIKEIQEQILRLKLK